MLSLEGIERCWPQRPVHCIGELGRRVTITFPAFVGQTIQIGLAWPTLLIIGSDIPEKLETSKAGSKSKTNGKFFLAPLWMWGYPATMV